MLSVVKVFSGPPAKINRLSWSAKSGAADLTTANSGRQILQLNNIALSLDRSDCAVLTKVDLCRRLPGLNNISLRAVRGAALNVDRKVMS